MKFEHARDRTLELFRTRPGYQDWSLNLEEGSAGLTSDEDWTRFYQFLANPTGLVNKSPMELPDEKEQTHTLPPCMEEVRYQNGPDTIIHVKHVDADDEKISFPLKKIQDAERLDQLPLRVPQETPQTLDEASNESCSRGVQEEKTQS